jgi:hypothetical protein
MGVAHPWLRRTDMSKGSPIIKARIERPLLDAIEADIARLNLLPQYGAMNMTDWLHAAIFEKLDHVKRNKIASRKRAAKKIFADIQAGVVCRKGESAYSGECPCVSCVQESVYGEEGVSHVG